MTKETSQDNTELQSSEVVAEKKVKLLSRLHEDQFVNYYEDEVIIPAQGSVILDEAGLTEIPSGIMKIEI